MSFPWFLPVDDDFAELLGGLEAFPCAGALAPGEDLVDDRRQVAGAEEGGDFAELVVCAHCGAQDAELVPEDARLIGLDDWAAGVAGCDEGATSRE